MRKRMAAWKWLGVLALAPLAANADAELELRATADGFPGGPVKFIVEGPLAEADVLGLTDAQGRTVGYAQKDGKLFVAIAPKLKRNETRKYGLTKAEDAPNRVELIQQEDHTIKVVVDGKHFTSYHYAPDLRKPFLYPVLLEEEFRMTRGYPMEEIEGEPKDHHHHTSWWVAYGAVNDGNFWHESADSTDKQRTDEIAEIVSGPVFGRLHAKNSWVGPEKKEVSEERIFTFYASDDADRTTDMQVTFIADEGDALFKDTKEGGIVSFRMNPQIDEKVGNGKMKSSAGCEGSDECWGKAAEWHDYSGSIDGQNLGIAVFDHPGNLRHPTRWHIRDYGLYSANCFGLNDFTAKDEERLNGDYTLAKGESLTFNYRVFIHLGDTDEAAVGSQYEAYTKPAAALVSH